MSLAAFGTHEAVVRLTVAGHFAILSATIQLSRQGEFTPMYRPKTTRTTMQMIHSMLMPRSFPPPFSPRLSTALRL